jgi:DNA-binding NtrC family response regulator
MLLLRTAGYEVRGYPSADEFMFANTGNTRGCVVLDVRMPGLGGIDLQAVLNERNDPLPIIFLTGHGDIPMSVRAMKSGAVDFLIKPVEQEVLLNAVQKALARDTEIYSGEIVGRSAAIRKVLMQVEQVASAGVTVLLLGETGTGKELLARALHARSPRHARPMIALNCAALPATLVESELFGREKGAYTGALTRQAGRFELADRSTLFLDEVGELPPETQVKLLRVLQDGRFERLGGGVTMRADVRVIAASNRDLERAVREGTFRNDLYYRLNVFPIRLPPLRERREDIPQLAWAFIKELAPAMGKTIESISPASLEALSRYDWPGNVRELRNVMERALIVCRSPVLHVEPPEVPSPDDKEPAEALTLEEVERRHIRSVLAQTGWRVSGRHGAAAVLGLKPTTLESRMAKLGIRRET